MYMLVFPKYCHTCFFKFTLLIFKDLQNSAPNPSTRLLLTSWAFLMGKLDLVMEILVVALSGTFLCSFSTLYVCRQPKSWTIFSATSEHFGPAFDWHVSNIIKHVLHHHLALLYHQKFSFCSEYRAWGQVPPQKTQKCFWNTSAWFSNRNDIEAFLS